jgi:hypothetical protein
MNSNMEIMSSPPGIKPSQRGDVILHVLFLSMASVVLLMSCLMRSDGRSQVFLPGFQSAIPSMCSTRVLTGIDCPGCGLTRAFISISHGKFHQAWKFNPASFAVYSFVAMQIPWHAIQLGRIFRRRRPLESSLVYLAPIGLVVVLMVNWLIKLPSMIG